jgi:outer membrane protein assembly factor BamB
MNLSKVDLIKIPYLLIISFQLFMLLPFPPIYGQSNIQTDIVWPTLSNSPSPMTHGNPQSNGRVNVVGPRTPNVIWKVNYPGGIVNGLAISKSNILYFGTENSRYFIAMGADTLLNWTYDGNFFQFAESSILIDSQENIYFGSLDQYFYAFRKDGSLKWRFKMDNGAFCHLCNIGLDSVLYFTTCYPDKNLYAVKSDGTFKWRISCKEGFHQKDPIISPDGSTIYIGGYDSTLYAINLDGTVKWKYPCGPFVAIPLVDTQGNIYIVPMQKPTSLISLYPNGTVRWKYTLDKNHSIMFWSSPCIDKNGNIFFIDYDESVNPPHDQLFSLDYHGNLRWKKTLDEEWEYIASPLACDADGKIYFGSSYGTNYYCYENDGNLLWKLSLEGHEVDI